MNRTFMVLSIATVIITSACSGTRSVTTENPGSQSSVNIQLKDGGSKQGIVLKRDGDNLIYVDAQSHHKETLTYSNIQKISKADVVYDYEANVIPEPEITASKGMNKTLLWGGGGLVLGAAAGAGVGIALVGSGVDVSPLISVAALGIAGAWYFGSKGSDADYEQAVFEVRRSRYEIFKSKNEKILEEEKNKLEEQKREKEELLKKIKEKKEKEKEGKDN